MSRSSHSKIRHLWIPQLASDVVALIAAYYTTFAVRFQSALGENLFTTINRFLGVRDTGALGEPHAIFYSVSAPRILSILGVTLFLLYALRELQSVAPELRLYLRTE